MKVGDHCYINKVSSATISFYEKLRKTGLPLICSCSLKNTDELVITDKLNSKFFLLKVLRNSQLTVAHFSDLKI